MLTRLQTGAIERRNYATLCASLPEIQFLQIAADYPCYTGFSLLAESVDYEEPKHFKVAATNSNWQQAMQDEFDAFKGQGTWILVPHPHNRTIIGSKWVYMLKKNHDGSISRYKAHLMAQGYTQEHGLDYSETFSPVVCHTTEEIYMKQPQGFVDSRAPNHVCKLVKSLYGLKQAPRAWNAKFTDDIILTGSNVTKVQNVITALSEIFDLKDMGRLTYFLGLHIQYKSNGDVFISQTKYAKELLKRAGMENCRPAPTPAKPHTQLLVSKGEPLPDPSVYRSIVGALQYLTFTRSDIAHSVHVVCQYMTCPTDAHMFLVKRILRYLQGTLHYGLTYHFDADIHISAYSDADWASNINTRRSVTGYVVFLGSNPISWQSKKQSSVSRNSTEAEYKALANCTADVCWIRTLMRDLNQFLHAPPDVHGDNISALSLSTNQVFHSRIKHLDTDYHFIR
ncbi:unnamed protein product [Malus baccata var. baccata]